MEPRHLTSQALPLLERCPEDIPVYTAAPEVLTRLTGFHLTRGMLCAMRRPALPTVEEVRQRPAHRRAGERHESHQHRGHLPLCCCAGDGRGAAHRRRERPLYRRASRVSMGNVFLIPWTYLPEEAPWPERLRRLGFQTVAMALREDSLLLNDPRLMAAEKLAVVLGTEGDGLSDGTIAACDYTVRIPMTHGVDS